MLTFFPCNKFYFNFFEANQKEASFLQLHLRFFRFLNFKVVQNFCNRDRHLDQRKSFSDAISGTGSERPKSVRNDFIRIFLQKSFRSEDFRIREKFRISVGSPHRHVDESVLLDRHSVDDAIPSTQPDFEIRLI